MYIIVGSNDEARNRLPTLDELDQFKKSFTVKHPMLKDV